MGFSVGMAVLSTQVVKRFCELPSTEPQAYQEWAEQWPAHKWNEPCQSPQDTAAQTQQTCTRLCNWLDSTQGTFHTRSALAQCFRDFAQSAQQYATCTKSKFDQKTASYLEQGQKLQSTCARNKLAGTSLTIHQGCLIVHQGCLTVHHARCHQGIAVIC